MGQAFRAAVMRGDRMTVFGFPNPKLTEHSYAGDPGVTAVMRELFGRPARVAWIGEYSLRMPAPGRPGRDRFFCLTRRRWMRLYQRVWNGCERRDGVTACDITVLSQCHLVNRTRRQVIDLRRLKEGDIHPLPVLTACGNGRGYGDYRGRCSDMAGLWAGDVIEVVFNYPEGYSEIRPAFESPAGQTGT